MTEQALRHLCETDRVLGALIQRVGPCRLTPRNGRSPFESLVRAVVYQQLNGTAAATILKRVKALFPNRRFPRPQDLVRISDAKLRGAGLSRLKQRPLSILPPKH